MDALEIQVLSGVHAGARYAIGKPRFRLAGDEHAELILLDEGIEQVDIAFELTDAGNLSVTSRDAYEVVDAGGLPVRPNTRWARGQFLVVAGVWLALAGVGEPLMTHPARREPELAQVFAQALRRPAAQVATPAADVVSAELANPDGRRARKVATIALGSIVALVLIAGIGTALLAVSTGNSIDKAVKTDANQLKNPRAALSATSATVAVTPEDLAAMRSQAAHEALARMIARGDLSQSVSTEWGKEGGKETVAVNATLNSSEVPKFEQIMADFERDHGAVVTVSSKVTPSWTLLPFRVREVVLGPHGWLVTDQGQRVLLGGEVEGYKLTGLSSEKVVLEGPRRVEIDL